jgi:hypothetical protein
VKNTLKFRSGHRFKIVQFTDIHWENGEEPDQQSADLMVRIAKAEAPDLIVLTGDILSGGGCDNAADSLREVAKIVEGCGAPWAAVFGNHDDEGSADRNELMAVLQEGTLSLAEPGPTEIPGVGNYVLPIQSSEENVSAALLYFIDSGSYSQTRIDGYDWIKREQIVWYLQESAKFTAGAGHPLPALAFFSHPNP